MARDYESYSKEALIEHIHELEKQLKNNKYGLYWDKDIEKESVVNKEKAHIPVLRKEEELCIVQDPEQRTHLLIEGDNFHSLTALNMLYGNEGFVDVVYIDPPYNTGEDDFVYNDKFVNKDDGFKHSKWLSFMNNRLRLIRSSMKDTAVIFVSIDDHEMANLTLLMNSIFNENNFIAMAIHKNNSSKNQSKLMGVSTEYVLIYAKNKQTLLSLYPEKGQGWKVSKRGASDVMRKFKQLKDMGLTLEEIESDIKDMYKRPKYSHLSRWNKVNEKGVFVDADLSRANGPKNYTITNPETGKPCLVPSRGWGKSHEELLRLQEEDLIWYGDDTTPPRMISYITGEDVSVPDNFWYYDNSVDTKLIKKIFGYEAFENPKPVEMIKTILEMTGNKDAVVLDAFAGSGTTGHAVLQLNNEDGGNRKFVLCTNNENNICEEITRQRIQAVITGKGNNGAVIGNEIPANLMYYKTDFIEDSRDTDQAKYCLVEKVDELLCIIEETYVAKERTDYFSHYETLSGDKHTFIYSEYYNDLKFAEFAEHINAAVGEIIVYMFSTDNTVDTKLFENMDVTVKPIPSKIYEIYREIVEDIKRGEQ